VLPVTCVTPKWRSSQAAVFDDDDNDKKSMGSVVAFTRLDSRQWMNLPQIEPDPVLARSVEVAMYRKRIAVLKGPSAPMPPDNRLLHAPVKPHSIRKRTIQKSNAFRGRARDMRFSVAALGE
jgi:hypothetical protein